jgi:hypothetical protein
MRTLLTLTALMIATIWLSVWVYIDEGDERIQEQELSLARRTVMKLQQEIRMGPKPYALNVPVEERSVAQVDSVMIYFSHMTHHELYEVKNNITENVALKGFIDTLLMFKDSLEHAHGIYSDE